MLIRKTIFSGVPAPKPQQFPLGGVVHELAFVGLISSILYGFAPFRFGVEFWECGIFIRGELIRVFASYFVTETSICRDGDRLGAGDVLQLDSGDRV